ncbi:TPA: primosomal replication protein PriB/PriC domain protein [Pseudomonas aeruginosa]|uniref:primosomal replication protein PriB/PriC domain protein n=1 Tax=Pseudomonas aeruginosa TaxID=287 RepID=UPI00192C5E2F|nr:primosomal replication protein PriB/PriC domain protein [Pseudomonas aeruginosa]HBO0241414.1 primosomal replication protein PriB/PriC domain protein [Pseudomonas aeruginosa]HBO0387942.1 primosomal replication protein PriB/PriC domain protein [Pseudomonas aeruginosa]HCF2507271.1 primosomal replication protein PriB/PriC domain protein [Pseudomonas aeruginosa]HEP8380859.1 primosomal replication protein PriB/PriC domain protein [Pseudomonas aeruginosa]
MAMNLEQSREILQRYIEAEQDVLLGKTVSFNSRILTMVDLGEIRRGRQEWERKVAALERIAGGQSRPYKLAVFE